MQALWTAYFKAHLGQVQAFAQLWIVGLLELLETTWRLAGQSAAMDVLKGIPSAIGRRDDAALMRQAICQYEKEIQDSTKLSIDLFIFY